MNTKNGSSRDETAETSWAPHLHSRGRSRLVRLFAVRQQRPGDEQPCIDPPARSENQDWSMWGAARDGARVTLTARQKICLLLSAAAVCTLGIFSAHTLLLAFIVLMTTLYLVTGLHKSWLVVNGEWAIANGSTYPPAATDDDLPGYTILVALHREGRILPSLVQRLAGIDYPVERLEILLLIESDDDETQRALSGCHLPRHMRPVIVPPGQPRTKPRALNVGLACASGDYIVIYDAEDHPEPGQLRKAVAAFRALPDNVVCVQARLNFYNWRQSLLTTLFAVDYAVWYELMLPGLTRAAAFVPLGGTSNHFRVTALHSLGGWDPFNVTEDCDLGARIARKGLGIAMLDSTTWEEAVPRVRPWIRQRSRWVKGYIQTYLVHMRAPVKLWRELGPRGFADFQLLAGAQSLVLLLNPVVWMLTAVYALSKGTAVGAFVETLFPASVYYLALLCFVVGNFVFFYINLYVCVRRDYEYLARYALLSPVYWLLMSIGAWTGFISLIRHPHYWAKTEHGVSLPRLVVPASTIGMPQRGAVYRGMRQSKQRGGMPVALACIVALSYGLGVLQWLGQSLEWIAGGLATQQAASWLGTAVLPLLMAECAAYALYSITGPWIVRSSLRRVGIGIAAAALLFEGTVTGWQLLVYHNVPGLQNLAYDGIWVLLALFTAIGAAFTQRRRLLGADARAESVHARLHRVTGALHEAA